MASVGVSLAGAQKLKMEVEDIILKDSDRPEFMSTYKDVTIRVV